MNLPVLDADVVRQQIGELALIPADVQQQVLVAFFVERAERFQFETALGVGDVGDLVRDAFLDQGAVSGELIHVSVSSSIAVSPSSWRSESHRTYGSHKSYGILT